MPFANYSNFADCVRQNPQADDPSAYCGSIQARTENKLHKAVRAADPVHQAVRLALEAVVEKRDPVKEEGKKKLTEADGVAADGSQDDQPFAVAFGADNYDKLTKSLLAVPYRQSYQAAGAIVKAIERKAMNFPGDLEDHLKKAHAAIHGREMWDARYGDVCSLLKRARQLLRDIEKTAEVAEQGEGAPQVGKADPVDKQARPRPGGRRAVPEGGWGKDPFAGQRTADGAIDVSRTQPMLKPPKPQNKALRKAVTAAVRQAGR